MPIWSRRWSGSRTASIPTRWIAWRSPARRRLSRDDAYFRRTCQAVIDSREALSASLQALGFEVLPSAANFVFARHPRHDAGQIASTLREQGVIVRHFKQARIDQFLRITIGSPEQNQALLDALHFLT
nr:aminotransferase class I/II-fold pyridoxal phosphate-dependent enzyme [Pseudomonas aeruginosa]